MDSVNCSLSPLQTLRISPGDSSTQRVAQMYVNGTADTPVQDHVISNPEERQNEQKRISLGI